MFTGLIEEIGTIKDIRRIGLARRFTVAAEFIMDDIKIDDSVAINGVCQTVVAFDSSSFEVEAVEETIRKTTFAGYRPGKKVNLERALRPTDRMGGHLVQGHVDDVGHVLSIQKQGSGILIWISFPPDYAKYIVPVGSICVDGVSLTVAQLEGAKFMLSIIPHTWEKTTLAGLRPGAEVNLEFDLIGKYVENMVNPYLGKPDKGMEKYLDL